MSKPFDPSSFGLFWSFLFVSLSVSQGGTGNLSHITPNNSLGFVQATPSRVLPSPTVNTREALGECNGLFALGHMSGGGGSSSPGILEYQRCLWSPELSSCSVFTVFLFIRAVSNISSGFVSCRCDNGHVPGPDSHRGPVQQHIGAPHCWEGGWARPPEKRWICWFIFHSSAGSCLFSVLLNVSALILQARLIGKLLTYRSKQWIKMVTDDSVQWNLNPKCILKLCLKAWKKLKTTNNLDIIIK